MAFSFIRSLHLSNQLDRTQVITVCLITKIVKFEIRNAQMRRTVPLDLEMIGETGEKFSLNIIFNKSITTSLLLQYVNGHGD